MNILLINHYAGSKEMGMEFRPYYFAKKWVEMGHKVTIISASFSHLRRVNPKVEKDFQIDNIEGIDYCWIKTGTYSGNGGQRAKTMGEFIGKLLLKTKKIVKEFEPDVVICSSTYPLDTYVGQRINRLSKKPVTLIHEVHDMWPLSPILLGGMDPKHPFIRVMQRGENSFCKNSDKVVSLLPATKDYFIEHGMKAENFYCIQNGVVLEEWENYTKVPEEVGKHFEKLRERGMFNLCFFGSIHKSYNLDMLIDIVKKPEFSKVAVTFIGPGHDKEELIEKSSSHREQFFFFDPIKKSSIPDLFNYVDGVFVSIVPNGLSKYGIAMNKLFDSMMGGKPILYMAEAPNDYIAEYNCGISVKGRSPEDLEEGLRKLISLNEEEKKVLGENGRSAVLENFNYDILSKKFIEVMEDER